MCCYCKTWTVCNTLQDLNKDLDDLIDAADVLCEPMENLSEKTYMHVYKPGVLHRNLLFLQKKSFSSWFLGEAF